MRTLLSTLALLAVACGGKVVVDTGTDTSGSGGSSGSLCTDVCAKTATMCGTGSATMCDAQCAKIDPLFQAACPDAWNAFLECSDKNPTCSNGGSCTAEMDAVAPCITMACSNNPTACTGN